MELLKEKEIMEIYPYHRTSGFYSQVFLRAKPSGRYRLILNLKNLNKYVFYRKFKMETMFFYFQRQPT